MSSFITSKQIIDAVANTPQVVFEITDACNLKCKYCLYGDLYEKHILIGENHVKIPKFADMTMNSDNF